MREATTVKREKQGDRGIACGVVHEVNNEVERRELRHAVHRIIGEEEIASHTADLSHLGRRGVLSVHNGQEIGARNL